ncbi:hypothetical protein [Nocardia panacis]|uniref:hypothetical protein n=1 Tax=Nocardia panacis TaxID=2340916 RepID=UPI0011C4364F|nr:hypothetical protein [Nocardia panacis]
MMRAGLMVRRAVASASAANGKARTPFKGLIAAGFHGSEIVAFHPAEAGFRWSGGLRWDGTAKSNDQNLWMTGKKFFPMIFESKV